MEVCCVPLSMKTLSSASWRIPGPGPTTEVVSIKPLPTPSLTFTWPGELHDHGEKLKFSVLAELVPGDIKFWSCHLSTPVPPPFQQVASSPKSGELTLLL